MPPRRTPRISRRVAALAGVVVAALGLGVAELASASSRRLQSPVLDVGDRVVDRVPSWLKNLAIDWFGTNDKIALLWGIGLLLVGYAAVVGLVYFRYRRAMGLVGVALFGLLGALAALGSRTSAPWWAALPSIAGGAAAALGLVALDRLATADHGADATADEGTHRRRLLVGLGAVGGAAVLLGAGGRRLGARFDVAGTRRALRLPPPDNPLAPVGDGVRAPVPGVSPFFTPNDEFYRIDTALTVPQIPIESWELVITGMVDRPRRFEFSDLLDRELIERDITLTCVSNEVGGNLLGTARWLGVRLDDLLAEAGVDADADQIVGRSIDGYTCGFPVAALDGRDAMVAIGMNGEPLPLAHGYPARLVVPGLYGYVSATKWLVEIELTRFDDFDQYWVPRGWDARAPIKLQSRIDTPRGLATVAPGPVAVGGVAWAQTVGIRAVELSVDDGPWEPAILADEVNDVTWRQWHYPWTATPGRHTLTVRAIDADGNVQTADRMPPMPNGATGQHQIVVMVAT